MFLQTILLALVRSGLAFVGVGGEAPLIDDAQLEAAGMYRFWQAKLPLMSNDSVVAGYLVDDALYVTTDRGGFFTLAAGEGLIRWAENLTEPDYRIYRPAHIALTGHPDAVVIPTTTFVAFFDRFSGTLLRKFRPPFPTAGPAIGYGNTLLMGGIDGRFHSLQLDDPIARDPIVKWTVEAGGAVTSAPVLFAGDMLAFASQGGTAYACRADDKFLAWTFRADKPILGDLAVDDTGVYVAGTDRSLYKIDRMTGRRLWRLRMPRPLNVGPVVTAETVFQFCPDSGLSAIDPDTGRERWRHVDGRSLIARAGTGDFLFTDKGRIDLVDHASGAIKHSIAAPDVRAAVLNSRDDALYLLGGDGRVLCARLDTVPYLRRQMVRAAQERLNKAPGDDDLVARPNAKKPTSKDALAKDPLRSRRDFKP